MKSMVTASIKLDLQTVLKMVEQKEQMTGDDDDDGMEFLQDMSMVLHNLAGKYGREALRKERLRAV